MRRLIVTLGIVLSAFFGMTVPAHADIVWCRTDPIITLNGAVVDLSTSIPFKYVPLVNGPISYQVTTPRGTDRQLVANDAGYNGYGTKVVFVDGSGKVQNRKIPTTISVSIPIDTSRLAPGEVVPTQLTIIADNVSLITATGTSKLTTATIVVTGH